MANKVVGGTVSGHSTSVVPPVVNRSTRVDHALSLLRKAASDRRWTLDALAAEMGKDKSYISRVFNGEKPLTLEFVVGLPSDVEATYYQYRAEAFGLVVVEPCDEESARRHFAAGLFNLITKQPQLPAKADHMARVTPRRKEEIA